MNKKYCINCGKQIDESWEYCKHCGTVIENNSKEKIKIEVEKTEKNIIKTNNKKNIIKYTIILLCLTGILGIGYFLLNYRSIDTVKNSVVKIITYDGNNNVIATGSGFCAYKSNLIVTNFHVIEEASRIEIQDDNHKTYNVGKLEIFNYNDDLAIISGYFNFSPIKVKSSSFERVGTSIKVIGSPEGELNTVSTGVISSLDNKGEIRITAPISPGSSGGVLLNKMNQCIGIVFATYDSDSAQNLNYAIDSSILNELWLSYNRGDFSKLTSSSYKKQLSSKNPFDYTDSFKSSDFSIEDLSVLRLLTSDETKFSDILMSNANGSELQGIFSTYSLEDRYAIVELYKRIKKHSKHTLKNLSNQSGFDAIVDTEIINDEKFAMMFWEYCLLNDIETVISKYPMEEGEDIFLRLVYGDLTTNKFRNAQYEAIWSFITANCDNDGIIAWCDMYNISLTYDSNGMVTYGHWEWWY